MDTNLLGTMEDIRISTGAFPYIRIQPRDVMRIMQVGSKYYYNNSGGEVTSLNPNILAIILFGKIWILVLKILTLPL